MFAEIGRFLQKNVIDPVDRAVIRPIDKAIIRPIDKAVIQPIREATDKDYALRHERKQVESLEKKNAGLRPQFFQAQQDLAVAQAAYEHASEDFSDAHGQAGFRALANGRTGTLARVDPRAGTPEILRAVEDGSRFVLKTVTLGLTEAIFNKDEIPRERAFLKKKISRLTDESRQLTDAIRKLRDAESRYKAATAEIKAEHAKLGAEATASDVHVISARAAAQKEIIQRLLLDDLSQANIAEITGISPEMIAEVAQNSAGRKGQ
jgi:hypothetical protein